MVFPDPVGVQPTMTRQERNDLQSLAKLKASAAVKEVRRIGAERLVELNRQLEQEWDAQELGVQQLIEQIEPVLDAINAKMNQQFDARNIMQELRPRYVTQMLGGWVGNQRRNQLRQMLKDENDAAIKQAEARVEHELIRIRETLVRDGLTSAAAKEFLNTMPTAAEMLPDMDVSTILSANKPVPAALAAERKTELREVEA